MRKIRLSSLMRPHVIKINIATCDSQVLNTKFFRIFFSVGALEGNLSDTESVALERVALERVISVVNVAAQVQ